MGKIISKKPAGMSVLKRVKAVMALFILALLLATTNGCELNSEEPRTDTPTDAAVDGLGASPAQNREAREREFQEKIKDPLLTPVVNPENSERVSAEIGFGEKSDIEIMRERIRRPRIASLGPLTGELSYYGNEARKGAELASEELDAAGGVHGEEYELLIVDSQGSIAGMQVAIDALIEHDIIAIVGAGTGDVSFAANKSINENQIIKISAGSRRRLGDTGPYNFRNSLDDAAAIESLVAFIKKEKKWDRFALFSSVVDDYSVQLTAHFKVALINAGMEVSHELYLWGAAMSNVSAEDASIAAQVKTFSHNPPDAVVFTGSPAEAVEFITEMDKRGMKIPVIGSEDLIEPTVIALGKKADGMLVYSGFDRNSPQPRVRRFVEAYTKKFGVPPSRLAALSYDSFNMVVEAARRAPSLRPSHVRKELGELKEFSGVTGPTTINEVGEALKEPFIFEFKSEGQGGEFVVVADPFR